jgi:ABC-type lipoprotein release transport system permease subunit
MIQWAWKTLISQRGSVAGSALGIAAAFTLVIFFGAVFRGESSQIVAYPANIEPDVWVMQTGVNNMHMAASFLWDWKADRIEAMDDVKKVTPILYMNTVISAGGQEAFAFIVGLLPGDDRAGPWQMAEGRTIQNPGEVVIPDVLSALTGVDIGESISITDRKFTVVGLSTGTYSSANAVMFIPFQDMEEIMSSTGTYSYLLVDARDGVDPAVLAERIRLEVDKVNALPHEEFIKNDFALAMQMGVEIIFMMTVICSALAALIIGFTAYTLATRKRQELAIAKALGTRNGPILLAVVFQSVVLAASGYVVAVIFALTLIPYIPSLVPQLTLVVSMGAIARIGLVALFVAVLGSLIPAWTVTRLDPATAFHV